MQSNYSMPNMADPLATAPWPYFDQEMIDAVESILRSGKVNYWTGAHGKAFEQEFATACNVEFAVAVANGTAALETALHALHVGPGDEVIVPCRSFIASASSVVLRGAKPIFADVDPISQNLTAETVARQITPRTRAIVAVHLAGWPCDMDPLLELAKAHDIKVIEDVAQAHGAKYKGRPVGSMGDIGAFSFCQDKIMTTAGEGGMIVTNDRQIWNQAWSYRDHGKDYDALNQGRTDTGFRWVHHQFGTNWRMTEVQAAVGRIALRRLDEWVRTRRRNASILHRCLTHCASIRLTPTPDDFYHSYYKFYAFVRPEKLRPGWSRDRVMHRIQQAGVPCYTGSCSEIYLERAFAPEDRPKTRMPVAKELGETSLMLLVHPTLSETAMHQVGRTVAAVLSEATDTIMETKPLQRTA